MNITSPIMAGAARVAELPGDSVTSLLKMIRSSTGLFDDGPDGGLGLVMSALAGVAAALAVAILFSVYFRSGCRQAPRLPSSSDRGIWPMASPRVTRPQSKPTTPSRSAIACFEIQTGFQTTF
jgi:hypothetical protein